MPLKALHTEKRTLAATSCFSIPFMSHQVCCAIVAEAAETVEACPGGER
jgi:hypothetical protein